MLFWIVLIVLVAFACLAVIGFESDRESFALVSTLGTIAMAFVAIIMIVSVVNTHVTADAKEAEAKQIYESLLFETQAVEIRDEFGISNKDYLDDVKDWNAELARDKDICHNFWVGIFYANYYDDLEYIDLDSIVFYSEETALEANSN